MRPRDEIGERPDAFRVALGSIGDAVIVTDAAGRVTFMNPVAETLTGWQAGESLGRPVQSVFQVVNEGTRRPVASPVEQVLARGVVVGLANHTQLIARDGTERPIDDSAAPIPDGAGGLAGCVLVFRDISERRRAERESEGALAYAGGIVETVRYPLVVLSADLRVKTANRAFYRTFQADAEQTEGRCLWALGGGRWDVPALREQLEQVLPRGSHFDRFEMDYELRGVGRRALLLNARRLEEPGDGLGLILLAIEDITEQRRAAQALTVSETRYRRLFETAQDGILILDADTGRIFDANPFLVAMLGYDRDELVGRELWEVGPFKDIEASRVAFRRLQQEGYIRYEDLPLQTRDGRAIAVEFVSNVYLVDHSRVIQCNIRDVTDRKRAEEALREAHSLLEKRVADRTAELARVNDALTAEVAGHKQAESARLELLGRLALAEEAERRRLARELHDQMGQHLTALSLGLKSLRDSTADDSAARARLQQLQELADLMGREAHQLALDLRPTALDDLGLLTALTNYVESWAERSGLEADFHSTGLDGERLPPAVETALYRVAQEALTNVLKHARAHRVSVILRRAPHEIIAVIEDDGRGFNAAAPGAGRLGVLGMRERLALVGGALTLESNPGYGTTIFARVPMPPAGGGG